MFVRQLIGREAGNIINMPFTAAQSCLAMGTVGAVTDEEIAAAGLELEPVVVNRPDELPRGFRVEAIPGGGFDLFDPGGVNVSKDVDLPNLIAARGLAWNILHPADAAEAAPDTTALEDLTKAELLKIAEGASIEIVANAKKAEIIEALVAAGITTPSVGEGSGVGGGAGDGNDAAGASAGAPAGEGQPSGTSGETGDAGDGNQAK